MRRQHRSLILAPAGCVAVILATVARGAGPRFDTIQEPDAVIELAGVQRGGLVAEGRWAGPPDGPQRLVLVVTVRNVHDRPVPVHGVDDLAGVLFVRDDGGRRVPVPRGPGEAMPRSPGPRDISYSDWFIAPGCALAMHISLERLAPPRGPGRYAVILEIGVDGYSSLLVTSPATFEIPQGGGGPRTAMPQAGHPAVAESTRSPLITPGDAEWRAAAEAASHQSENFTLDAILSPVNPAEVNLVASLRQTCTRRKDDYARFFPPQLVTTGTPSKAAASGTRASDYRILVRNAEGAPVPMTVAGRKWVAERFLRIARGPRLGEAIGFVFPLRRLFDLARGQEYTVRIAVPEIDGGPPGCVSAPLTVRVPALAVAGVTRPAYASDAAWRRLLHLAGRPCAGISLQARIDPKGPETIPPGYPRSSEEVDVLLSLKNEANVEANGPRGRLGAALGTPDPIILLRDAAGHAVPANESIRGVGAHVGFPFSLALAPGASTPGDRFPLSLVYDLRPGAKYTLLAAASPYYGQPGAPIAVANPLTFSVPTAADQWAAPAGKPSVAPPQDVVATVPQTWESLSRFAGKEFEGLQLEAKAGVQAAKPGEATTLSVVLRDRGNELILVKKWKGESDYEILIRDAAGKDISLTEKGKRFFETGDQLDTRELKPGEAISATLPLSELFDLKTPGQYTVLASLPVLGDVDAVLTASPIKLEIKPDEAHK